MDSRVHSGRCACELPTAVLWSVVFGIGQANQVGDRTVISLSAKCVLLDIEGTTSSIAFVYEVMFAYVRKHLHSFLVSNWDTEGVQKAIEQMAQDAQVPLSNWLDSSIGALESLAAWRSMSLR